MNWKSWALAATAACALAGCNIFNPNGAAKASCSGTDAGCYLSLGQALIQERDFTGAMAAYQKAIALDSTLSEGYWGYARSAVYKFNVNTGDIIDDLAEAGGGNINAFMQHSDAVLTQRIRLAHEVVRVMDAFIDRDTLSAWYRYLTDSSKAQSDTNFAARKAFIAVYLDTSTGSRARDKFPLTDNRKNFQSLLIEYAAYKMMYKIMDFNDLAPKLYFDESDRKMSNILKSDGTFGNLIDLADEMENDTALQNEVNDKIRELQSGMGDVTVLLGLLGVENSGGSGGTEQQSKSKMDSAVTSLGKSLVFYQFGDRVDNDADGCIDEEIVDSLDNDYDGFVDEDARLIKGTGSASSPGDLLNNDRQGAVDDIQENLVGDIIPNRREVLTFVYSYMQANNQTNATKAQVDWVKHGAKKDSVMMNFRIALQADSLAVRLDPTAPGYSVPAHLQAKLDSAKTYIGGCWRHY